MDQAHASSNINVTPKKASVSESESESELASASASALALASASTAVNNSINMNSEPEPEPEPEPEVRLGLGLGLGLGLDASNDDTSMLLSPNNTTMTSTASSIASASTGTCTGNDMNKSVLSDTTELTASNFVFAEKSRMMQFEALAKEHRDREEQKEKEKEEKMQREKEKELMELIELKVAREKKEREETDLMKRVEDEGIDIGSPNSTDMQGKGEGDDKESRLESDETADSLDLGNLLQDSMTAESLNIGINISATSASAAGVDTNTNAGDDVDKDTTSKDGHEIKHASNGSNECERKAALNTTVEGLLDFDDSIEDLRDREDDSALNEAIDMSMARNMSVRRRQPRSSIGSSPFFHMNIPVSSKRNRRQSHGHRFNNDMQQNDSVFRKSAKSVRKLTASIQKSKQLLESRRKSRANLTSLPSRFNSSGLAAFKNMEDSLQNENLITKKFAEVADPNMTFDDGENRINDLLVDLVGNNNVDESMDEAPVEKLNMSSAEGNNESTSTPMPYTPTKIPHSLRVYQPSPARSTRSAKKRMSSNDLEESLSMPVSKKSDRKTSPQKQPPHEQSRSIRRRSILSHSASKSINSDASSILSEGDDDTHMMMTYLVPNLGAEMINRDSEITGVGGDRSAVQLPLPPGSSDSESSTHLLSCSSDQTEISQSTVRSLSIEKDTINPMDSSPQGTLSSNESPRIKMSLNRNGAQVTSDIRKEVDTGNGDIASSDNESSDGSLGLVSLPSKRNSIGSELKLKASTKISSFITNSPDNSSPNTNDLLQNSGFVSRSGLKSPFAPPLSMKSEKLEISSPLSDDGARNGDDLISLGSPQSNSSSDMSFDGQSKGGDGITANTAALRDIMADINDDLIESAFSDRKKLRRMSSAFSVSSRSERSTHIELDTADTQDMKGLLSNLEFRGSSLLPINEVKDKTTPRNDEAIKSPMRSPDQIIQSSLTAYTPKSILKKKRSSETTPKRNVVFCPPVAAEYNIGSPSTSFTPMCAKVTKALFTIPHNEGESDALSESDNFETIERTDSDVRDLSRNNQSKQDSEVADCSNTSSSEESAMAGEQGQTVSLELDLGTMLGALTDAKESKASDNVKGSEATEHSNNLPIGKGTTAAVSDALRESLESNLSLANSSKLQSSDTVNTFEIMDESIEEITVGHSLEGQTLSLELNLDTMLNTMAKSSEQESNDHMNFTNILDDSNASCAQQTASVEKAGSQTVSLEMNLENMLGVVIDPLNASVTPISDGETKNLSLKDSSMLRVMEGETQTIGLEGDLKRMLERYQDKKSQDLIAKCNDGASTGTNAMVSDETLLSSVDQSALCVGSESCSEEVDFTVPLESDLNKIVGNLHSDLKKKSRSTYLDDTNTISSQRTDFSVAEMNDDDTSFNHSNEQSTQSLGTDDNTVDLENGLKGMLNQVHRSPQPSDWSPPSSEKDDSFKSNRHSVACESDNSDTMNLEKGLQEMIRRVDHLGSQKERRYLSEDDTMSLGEVSILQKSEETVGLENDLQVLLGKMAGSQSTGRSYHSSQMSCDKKLPTNEDVVETDSKVTFDADLSKVSINGKNEVDGGSALHSSSVSEHRVTEPNASETSNIIRSLEKAVASNSISTDFEDLNSSQGSRRTGRRHSRRFSLALSLDLSESPADLLNDSSTEKPSSIDGINHSLGLRAIDHEKEQHIHTVDMKWIELANFLPHLQEGVGFIDFGSDLLLDGSRAVLAEYDHPILTEKVHGFLAGVCNEIENNGDDGSIKSDTLITQCIENQDSDLYTMQQALRGELRHGDMSIHMKELKALDTAVGETTSEDFTNWELQVMSALGDTIEQAKFEVDDELRDIENKMCLLTEINNSLSTLSRELVCKARKESIKKRKVRITKQKYAMILKLCIPILLTCNFYLQDEVEKLTSQFNYLEADLQAAENELFQKSEENENIDSILQINGEKESLQVGLVHDRNVVEKKAEALALVEGVHNWKLVHADESQITVEFLGNVQELSFRADFSISSTGEVRCKTSNISNSNRKGKTKYTSSVKRFFAERVETMRKELSASNLTSSSDICNIVNHTEWLLGRLDIIGKEISMLELRHSGTLQRAQNSLMYYFNLSIKNKPKGICVNTTFDIGEWYPFALDIVISSNDVDVNALERHLIRNAKPGFGYLSRCIDVIAAFQGR